MRVLVRAAQTTPNVPRHGAASPANPLEEYFDAINDEQSSGSGATTFLSHDRPLAKFVGREVHLVGDRRVQRRATPRCGGRHYPR